MMPFPLSAVILAACAIAGGAAELPPADWMSRLPQDARLSALSIPGSHNAGARFEPLAGTAKCQDATLADQLAAGVRFLDLRCRHLRDSFAICHGMVDQRLTFDAALDQIAGFLKAHPGECVLVSVKEEHTPAENTRTFEATFDAYVAKAPERWCLGDRIPTLGEARGRMVLVRRFGAAAAKGIDASRWPDNNIFRTAQLAVQDCYQVPDVEAKWRRIETALEAARADGDSGRLHLNFTSGYRSGALGIPNLTAVAGELGPRLRAWFERAPAGHYGCVIMDFADAKTCAAILRTNAPAASAPAPAPAASPPAGGARLHVAPDGNDQNPGTAERPFASLRRAQQVVVPGDTVIIHGGTYRLQEADLMARDSFRSALFQLDKSGTRDRPIRYLAAPGERPVFDCAAVKPRGLRVSAFRVRGSWLQLKGFEVTGVQVTATGHTQSICVENLGNHNLYEDLALHDGQAIGLFITRGADNLVLNCDAYRNHDFTSGNRRGGNSDGFGAHSPKGGTNNVFRGCRAWFNSDDGFDCINAGEAVAFEGCWAFYNGYSPEFKPLADGNGFKAGGYGIDPATRFPAPVPRHRVSDCLAVRNRSSGFYANHHPGGCDWIRNTATRNSNNFNFLGRSADGRSDIPGRGHQILHNVVIGSGRAVVNLDPEHNTREGNTFDLPGQSGNAATPALDEASLIAPRRPDGSLPELRWVQAPPPAKRRQ